jgi:hypothetical protein
MIGDRLPEKEEAPRIIPPETAGDPDSLISNSSYPMTVLGGWPLEDMSGLSTQLIGLSTDNDNSVLSPIGFTFRMDNADYTTFGANGNGFITLGRVPDGASSVNNLSDAGISNPKAAPFWDDLCVGTNGKVHYKTIGAPGMRKLIVEWQNMQITRNGACSGPGTGTFQLWLLEGTGVIQFVYGNGMTETAAADGGYSVGISSTTGPMQTFATITTASNTVGYMVPNNSQTSAIPAGKSYVFVPNVPPPPSGGNVTALTLTSLQLNWTDNASTELFYQVRRSTDNINFTIISTLAPNSISFADSNLDPSTQYFYHVNALSEGALSQDLAISATTPAPGNAVSTAAGGLWSSPGTWVGGVVPGAGDDVTIVDGAVVTIDIAAAAFTLTVGTSGEPDEKQAGAAPATLTFEESAPHSLNVERNVLIKSNGIFTTSGLGNVTSHVLTVGRDLTNNGALDFSTNNNMAGAIIHFTGASNNVFNGTGPITDIRAISVNKGSSVTNTLELAPANFTVQGSTTDTPGSGFLTLNNGTFKISGTFTGAHRTFPVASYLIGPSTGFWLNNPNYTVTAQTGTASMVNSLLRVTSGTFNVGTTSGNSLVVLGTFSGGSVIIEGGAVNVTGRFGVSDTFTEWNYSQSGGTLTTCMSPGGSYSQLACFDAGASDLSSVTMTGGNIIIENVNAAGQGLDYRHQAGITGAATVTGGTVQFGNASTSGVSSFRGVGILPNMVIDSTTGGHAFTFGSVGVQPNLTRDVLISTGASFVTGSGPYLMNGSSFVNNGTLLSAHLSTNFVWFDPAGNPTYSGTGVVSGIMNGFTVQGQSVTINSSNNVRVRNIILITGNIINANKLTLGNNDTITSVIQIGSPSSPTPAGTFDTSPVFQLGSGGETLRYFRTGSIRTTGPEINPARSLAALTFDNNDPATDELNIAGGNLIVTGQLNLANGEIKTGANQLIHNGTVVGGGTGFVNGTVTRHIIVSGSYLIPVGVNGRSPVNLFVGLIQSIPSIISVKPVDATLPGLDPAISASRYWEITQSGNMTGQLSFFYTNADINGDEAAYGAWVSRGGGNPLLESQTNNPAQNSVSSSQPLTNFTGNWGPGCCVVPRSVGGTVRTAGGAPIRNATVVLSGGGLPAPRVAQTGSFGSFVFDNVLTGTQYNIFVSAKRFRFTPISRDIILAGDDFTQDFTANPQEGGLLFERKKP